MKFTLRFTQWNYRHSLPSLRTVFLLSDFACSNLSHEGKKQMPEEVCGNDIVSLFPNASINYYRNKEKEEEVDRRKQEKPFKFENDEIYFCFSSSAMRRQTHTESHK